MFCGGVPKIVALSAAESASPVGRTGGHHGLAVHRNVIGRGVQCGRRTKSKTQQRAVS